MCRIRPLELFKQVLYILMPLIMILSLFFKLGVNLSHHWKNHHQLFWPYQHGLMPAGDSLKTF